MPSAVTIWLDQTAFNLVVSKFAATLVPTRWPRPTCSSKAIVALPEQMFYNTGIGTYIWIVRTARRSRAKVRFNSLRRASDGRPCAAVSATKAAILTDEIIDSTASKRRVRWTRLTPT